ncbi:unnamed protein product [Paramecium pentaurelia]|uniref:Uncharacterized protein n=1 Tax=Paramecium pentaurelia TaxID=43138 RepID=A0A8S1VU36_9CILI|nr:unnamed protein product [Paramecium pentaurelia]
MTIVQSLIIDKIFINPSYATAGRGFHIATQRKAQYQLLTRIFPIQILYHTFQYFLLVDLPSGRSIESYQYFDECTYSLSITILLFQNHSFRQIQQSKQRIIRFKLHIKTYGIQFNFIIRSYTRYIQSIEISCFLNQNTRDYNLDDLVYWNPNYDQDQVLLISIECNEISEPFYRQDPPYFIQSSINNYKLLVDIRTFQCQLSEFLNQTPGWCRICDKFQNLLSITRKALNCSYKDNTKIRLIESSMIELRQYYWRAYNYSQNIEYCYQFPKNCQG